MALKIWLPLNGSLENKGTTDVTITNNGATVNTSGKIGSCYEFNGSSYMTVPYNGVGMESAFTIAAWVYFPAATSGNKQIIAFSSNSGWANVRCTMLYRTNSAQVLFSISDNSNYVGYNCNAAITPTAWNHCAVTYANNLISLYVNGELLKTYTTTYNPKLNDLSGFGIGAAYNGAEKFTGRINDVRIYDECLSQKEIKEIAQGLVLHYKLNGVFGGAGENLLSKYVSPGQGAPGSTATAGRTNYYGDYGITIPATENADTYFRLFLDKELEQNKIYTISCEVSGLLEGSYYRWPLFAQNNTSMGVLQTDHNGLCSMTFTMTYATQTAATINGRTVYVCFMDDSARGLATGQGPITITNFKIEEGSVATQFTKCKTDFGIDTTKVIDSSGYGNNGTITGSLTINNNGPDGRYSSSTYTADGRTDYVVTPSLNFNPNAVTLSIWFKSSNTTPTGNYHMVVDSNANRQWYEMCVNKDGYLRGGLFVNGTRYADNGTSTTVLNGNWHMLTMTYDGAIIKRYVDGVMEKSTTIAASTGLSSPTAITLFRDGPNANYACQQTNLADFRIYATALSAEDILDLYHTPANVDNLGNYHSFEFNETQTNLVNSDLDTWTKESQVTGEYEQDGFYHMDTHRTGTSSRYGIYTNLSVEPSTNYVFAIDMKEDNSLAGIQSYESTTAWSATRLTSNGEKRYYYYFTTGASDTVARIYLAVVPNTRVDGYFKNPYFAIVNNNSKINKNGIFNCNNLTQTNITPKIISYGELDGTDFIEK